MAAAKFTSGYFCTMEEAGDLVAKMPDDLLCGMQVFFSPEPDKLDNQKFIYGKNDILFLNADTNGVMKQITGATVPTPSFLTALARLHKERRQRCTAMGIEYFHIIVPNKETSLRAYLPDEFVFEAFGPTPARRYLESDKEILDFTFYDPDILAQSAVPTDFYPKQNSHWNNAGAVKYFSAALYALHAQDANNITQLKFQTITKNEVGDLGLHASSQAEKFNDICVKDPCNKIIYAGNIVNLGYTRHQISSSLIGKGRKILCLHDSFTQNLFEVIGNMWSEALTVHIPDLGWDLVEAFKPDVVLFLQAERFLPRLPQDGAGMAEMVRKLALEKNVVPTTAEYLEKLLMIRP